MVNIKAGDLVFCPIDVSTGEIWPKSEVKSIGLVIKVERTSSPRNNLLDGEMIVLVAYPAYHVNTFLDSWNSSHVELIK